MSKNAGWLRWETQASIHHLAITAQACQTPMYKYFGTSFPKTVLLYKGRDVIWSNEWGKLYELGAEIIQFYKDPQNKKKYISDWKKSIDTLNGQFSKLDKVDLSVLPNGKLLEHYNNFCEVYINFWRVGWLDEPAAFEGERLLKEAQLSDKDLGVLLSPSWKPFISEIEEDLLKISKSDEKKRKDLIDEHIRKYFWKRNNYLQAYKVTQKEVEKELLTIKKSEIKAVSKDEVLSKMSKDLCQIASIMDDFGLFQDQRKKQMMIAAYYLDKLLKETGKRSNLSLDEMRYTLRSEVGLGLIKNAKMLKVAIGKRQKHCALVWDGNKTDVKYGKAVGDFEKELFGGGKAVVTEVVGMTASPGTAIGKVIILKDPNDAYKVKEGDVLVAPMTSPDYVVAMKKAVAVVTDWGGMTSHAAIVAREFGIPCVVGTDVATKVFKDGDMVEVLADEGIVRKV